MAVRFEKIQPGMVLYDRHTHRMGNTTMKTIVEWEVRVISVDAEQRSAMVSWNGNSPRRYYEFQLRRLYDWSMFDDCAEVTRSVWGRVTKVTKKKAKKEREP